MKKEALIITLMMAATPGIAAPGLITANASPNAVSVGDTFSVTMRIQGYTDTVEIDGYQFDVSYPPGLFAFVAGSFDVVGSAADPQWLSKPNQETVAAGYTLTDFNANPAAGLVHIEILDSGFSMPERGTIAASGFMVSFKLTALAEGSGQICGRAVPGPAGPEVLYDTNRRPAGVPQFLCSNVVVRATCTNPPVIVCPSNIVVWTCSNSATVTYSATATSPCCPNVVVTCMPPSGSPFAAGTVTPVTCTARDTCNNLQSSCTFTVTVRPDTAPPVIHCPSNTVTYWVCTNQVPLTYTVTATDDCDTNVTIVCTPPAGTLVAAPGIYNVFCRATDDCGKSDTCQFTIRYIRDTTPPVINCPTNPVVVWTCTNTYVLDYTVTATDDCDTNVTIVCNLPPGTVVPAPSLINVSCSARDDCGNISGCQFTVRVIRDTAPPIINCPGDMTVWSCTNRFLLVYGVGVQDDCDTNVEVRCTLPDGTLVPSGTSLPLGNHVITCVARDDCGHTSSCSFTVRVIQDTTPPVINCPTNVVVWGCSNATPVTYHVSASDDCDPAVEIRCRLPSGVEVPPGTTLPPGNYVITCVARDDCDNTSTCSFTVRVIQDTQDPVLNCPTNVVLWACTNRAPLNYTVTATDDCDTNVSIVCTPPPGTEVPVPGLYNVVCVATDDCGNQDRCEFTIRFIRDDVRPVIVNCPTNVMTVWTCTNVWIANYGLIAVDDCDTNVTIECTPPAGTPLGAPGVYGVVCRATDDCGNVAFCQFGLRVIRDTLPPDITCPSNRVVKTCYDCERVEFRAEARDDCDTNVFIQCNPPSGTCFPVGTNSVVCVAIDDCGNRDECKFEIVVMKLSPPRLTIRMLAGAPLVQICWPAPSDGFRLQCAPRLHLPSDWVTITNVPTLSGSQWCVTLPKSGRHQFYRLCKPPRPTITGVRPLNPKPGDIVFIDGSGFGNNPDDLCVAIAAQPPDPANPGIWIGLGGPDTTILYPLRALFATDTFMTARMAGALPMDAQPGMLMVGHGIGHVGRFQPAFPDIHLLEDVWTWQKGDSDGMGNQEVHPQPTPPPPRECWFFSGAPTNCQLCVFLEPNCPWPSNSIVSITARAHDSVTGAGGYDLDGPTIRFLTSGGTVRDCAERIADVIRCAFLQQAGVIVEVHVDVLTDGRVKITVRIPGGCIDRGFLQICVRSGNDPVITSVEPTQARQGDLVTIKGANFGNNPDNLCVVLVENAGPTAEGVATGIRFIPLQALETTGDQITARLGPVPPAGPAGRSSRLMVGKGTGVRARFRPAFADVLVGQDTWVWRKNGEGAALAAVPFFPIPDPPPPPSNCWIYSDAPVEGKLCIYLSPNCPWPSNAYVTIIARAHDSTTGMGADLAGPNIRFIGGGTTRECAERLADVLRCAFLQQAGVVVEVHIDPLADGRVKITVTIPGGYIDRGMLTICVGPSPNGTP